MCYDDDGVNRINIFNDSIAIFLSINTGKGYNNFRSIVSTHMDFGIVVENYRVIANSSNFI